MVQKAIKAVYILIGLGIAGWFVSLFWNPFNPAETHSDLSGTSLLYIVPLGLILIGAVYGFLRIGGASEQKHEEPSFLKKILLFVPLLIIAGTIAIYFLGW